MALGVIFKSSPWGFYFMWGRAARFEPELVKLAALPRFQWAILALEAIPALPFLIPFLPYELLQTSWSNLVNVHIFCNNLLASIKNLHAATHLNYPTFPENIKILFC
jgi:hypothetical protein